MAASSEAEQILKKLRSDKWMLEDDCTLLAWMQKISENLEQRATATSESLKELKKNLNRTTTSLDNAANSLAALQYTQFVESRCHDDDETIASVAEVPPMLTDIEQKKSSADVLKDFLKNNLTMLHKCHEKYALDLEDSDDEDAPIDCIYQPRNPYNERLLPHIYGSKLWKENWHIGLCDGTNDYSGDEASDAYSTDSTISTPDAAAAAVDDNRSFQSSNTPNRSESAASSISMPHERFPPPMAVQNTIEPLFPEVQAQHTPSATGGSDVRVHDLFAGLHEASTSATADTRVEKLSTPDSSVRIPTAAPRRNYVVPLFDQIPEDNLFTEPTTTSTVTANQQQTAITKPTQIKRKPVNLFDDDDFNNFMSEIVDKAQHKNEATVSTTEKSTPSNLSSSSGRKATNLFDDGDDEVVGVSVETPAYKATPSKSSGNIFDSPAHTTRKVSNLFDDDADNDEVSSNIPTQTVVTPRTPVTNLFESTVVSPKDDFTFSKPTPTKTTTKVTPKSLFDDNDDDDDFLNIFGASKKLELPKSTTKNLFFDDEVVEQDSTETSKLKADGNESNASKILKGSVESQTTPKKTIDLFADVDDDDLKVKALNKSKEMTARKQTNLFGNDDEVEDNLFQSIKSQRKRKEPTTRDSVSSEPADCMKATIKPVESSKPDAEGNPRILKSNPFDEVQAKDSEKQKKMTPSKKNFLLEDIGSDDDDDDLFATGNKTKKLEQKQSKNDMVSSASPEGYKTHKTTAQLMTSKVTTSQPEKPSVEQRAELSRDIDELNSSSKGTKTLVAQQQTKHITVEQPKASAETTKSNSEESSNANDEQLHHRMHGKESSESPANFDYSFTADQNQTIDSYAGEPQITAALNMKTTANTTQNYSNIFSDEPPDDDDFFQTLSSSSTMTTANSKSASKLTLDLEQDFYEPPLPKAPINSSSLTTQKDNLANASSMSAYAGLNLFSDVPPDDDDDVDNTVKTTATANDTTNSSSEGTKRLQGIFYDDFAETIAAVKQPLATHSLFDNEPPPDDDDDIFNIIKRGKTEKTKEVATNQKPIAVDENNKKPHSSIPSTDVTDKAATLGAQQKPAVVSKLQMPNININVKALLPNAGGKLNTHKSFEAAVVIDDKQPEKPTAQPTTSRHVSESAVNPTSTSSTKPAHENMLDNVCKTRVRGPANRKPSTRRGRQENYQKSLQAAQETKALDNVEYAQNSVTETNKIAKPQNESNISQQLFGDLKSHNEQKHNKSGDFSKIATAKANFNDLFNDDDAMSENYLAEPKSLTKQNMATSSTATKVDTQKMNVDNKLSKVTLQEDVADLTAVRNTPKALGTEKPTVKVNQSGAIPKVLPKKTSFNDLFKDNSDEESENFLAYPKFTAKQTLPTPTAAMKSDTDKISRDNKASKVTLQEDIGDLAAAVGPAKLLDNSITKQLLTDKSKQTVSSTKTLGAALDVGFEDKIQDSKLHSSTATTLVGATSSLSQNTVAVGKNTKKQKPSTNIFGDDDDDDDHSEADDDILFKPKSFKETHASITTAASIKDVLTAPTNTATNDNLKHTAAEKHQRIAVEPQASTSECNDDSLSKTTQKITEVASKESSNAAATIKHSSTNKSKSIFDSGDSDSDNDLFKSSSKKTKAKEISKPSTFIADSKNSSQNISITAVGTPKSLNTKTTKTSLDAIFADDEEDDVFFAASKSNKFKTTSNIAHSTKQLAKSSSNTLFGDNTEDDDDDDDLFGNKATNKASIKSVTKTKALNDPLTVLTQQPTATKEIKTEVSTTKTNKVDDNPLADLLNS